MMHGPTNICHHISALRVTVGRSLKVQGLCKKRIRKLTRVLSEYSQLIASADNSSTCVREVSNSNFRQNTSTAVSLFFFRVGNYRYGTSLVVSVNSALLNNLRG